MTSPTTLHARLRQDVKVVNPFVEMLENDNYLSIEDKARILKCHTTTRDSVCKFLRLRRRLEFYECKDELDEIGNEVLLFDESAWVRLTENLKQEESFKYRKVLAEIIRRGDIQGRFLNRLKCWSEATPASFNYPCHYKDFKGKTKCSGRRVTDKISGIWTCAKHSPCVFKAGGEIYLADGRVLNNGARSQKRSRESEEVYLLRIPMEDNTDNLAATTAKRQRLTPEHDSTWYGRLRVKQLAAALLKRALVRPVSRDASTQPSIKSTHSQAQGVFYVHPRTHVMHMSL